jgi:hypothetical protein
MRITIEVHLVIGGIRSTNGGEFNIRYNQDISQFAYDWIKQIKRDTGYRDTVIEKVIVNGTDDLTDQVRKIDESPIKELDDIFW